MMAAVVVVERERARGSNDVEKKVRMWIVTKKRVIEGLRSAAMSQEVLFLYCEVKGAGSLACKYEEGASGLGYHA